MDLSALTDASAEAPRPPADNEAAMLLLGLYEQPSPHQTPQSAQGQLQGYQAERAESHQPDFRQSSHLTPTVAASQNGIQQRGGSPFEHPRLGPSASPVTASTSTETISPPTPLPSTVISGMATSRMLPPVPPSVAQQQAQAQSQSQVDFAQARQTAVNGTISGYRGPETYHSNQQSQLARTTSGSYSHQPLTATSSKSPSLSTVSPKQTFATSASAIGQNYNRGAAGTGGSPMPAYATPVISTGQNRISHLLNNPASSAMPPSPGRNGHVQPLPYHTHTYSSQPYKLVSTNNTYSSSSAAQQPSTKAQSNTSRTVYTGKQENATSSAEGQSSLRGYDSTAATRINGNTTSVPMHYSVPISPYSTPIMQSAPSAGTMHYVSVPGKGIIRPPVSMSVTFLLLPVAPKAVQAGAPRKRKRSASGSQATNRGLQSKSAAANSPSLTSNAGSNARPDLPHFMGFDNQLYRCICETTIEPERGSSVQCERCLAWQHAGCFGIKEETLEGLTYFCHICKGGNYNRNEEYIAYVRDLETRLMSGQVVSGILSVNPTLQLVSETAVPRDGKKTRGSARGRPRARENSTVSGTRPSVPPAEATTEGPGPDHDTVVLPSVAEKPSSNIAMPKPQRRKTGTARGTKSKVKDSTATTPADGMSIAPVSSHSNRPSTGNASTPTTHSPDRELQTTTRENTAVSSGAAVITDSSAPLRLLEYIPLKENILRGQTVKRIVVSLLEEWVEPAVPLPLHSSEKAVRSVEDQPPKAAEGPTPELHAQIEQETRQTTPSSLEISRDILGPPLPPAIIYSRRLEDVAVPTYVKAKDKDETFFFPPGRAFLNVPDPKDAPSTIPIRPSVVYGVHVRRTALPGDFLGEMIGEVKDSESYHRDPINQYATLGINKPFTRRLGPPVDLVIDGRIYGNDMRFVRSGCHPNAVFRPIVQHMEGNKKPSLSFGVFATTTIAAGQEVILAWEWDDDHVIHALAADVPAISKGSRLQHRFALVTSHLLGSFRSCACDDDTTCVWIRIMQLSVAGQPIPALNFRPNKKSRKAKDLPTGYGPLVGALRGWRRNEIARFEAELEQELLEKQKLDFEAEQLEGEETCTIRSLGADEDVSEEAESESEAELEGYVEEELTGGDGLANGDQQVPGDIGIGLVENNIMEIVDSPAYVGRTPLRTADEDTHDGREDDDAGSEGLSRHEDYEEDVDMDKDSNDAGIIRTDVAVQMTRGDSERTVQQTEPAGTPPSADMDVRPSVHAIDASPEANVSREISEGKLPAALLDEQPAAHHGRTAEEDSPLTSADTRETPSPLLLSADNAFASQLSAARSSYDESGDEDDGNLTDVTASTIPLSHHSDDEDNLEPEETPVLLPQSPLAVLPTKNEAIEPTPSHPTSPSHGKSGNTLYRRRRVLSPSSPVDEADRSTVTPSGVGVVSRSRRTPERAPSSSLSPVLPSNSLADMFNDEEPGTIPRKEQSTPIKQDIHPSASRKVDSPEREPEVSTSLSEQPGRFASESVQVSTAASLDGENLTLVNKEPTFIETSSGPDEMVGSQATEPSPVSAVQPEAQSDVQAEVEPAPPPKKRRLDLKKFMTSKRTNLSDTAITPLETATATGMAALPTSASPQTPITGDDLPAPSSFPAIVAAPPPLSPPPPPSITSPGLADISDNSKISETPWWTATPTSWPSFNALTETRPQLATLSGESKSAMAAVAVSATPDINPTAQRTLDDEKRTSQPAPVATPSPLGLAANPRPLLEAEQRVDEKIGVDTRAFSTVPLEPQNGAAGSAPLIAEPQQEPPKALTSPFDWHSRLPTTGVVSHWSKIPPALEQKDLPPHVDPDSRRSDRFGSMSSASRSPPKSSLILMSPQRVPPAGPRASLVPIRPLDMKDPRDLIRDREGRDVDRDRDVRERDREREVPRGPRLEYRGRGGAPRGSAFTPRGTWHADSYRGRPRGTGEFRGRGFFPRGRGAFFNSRGRGT
ncbi:hypothetical protein QFC19_004454 [Naganishia cerealis]|uniref:Uncharacterized protein n=1 Tax=Naganishia cerealis TaxID=610337 RepID=A0ACC2VW79_9TREE|nr:hypothetical protein QFC19_004454 [Naganishia cerealis]